jgi:hypothetical protein
VSQYAIVRHTVSYYPHWKAIFDKNQKLANENGLNTIHVLTDLINSNRLTILLSITDLAKAKEFMNSEFLKDAMKRAGVLTEPEILYLSDDLVIS